MKIEIEDAEFDEAIAVDQSAQIVLQRAAGTVQKLRDIESPCDCESFLCEHWTELATFIIAREEHYGTRNEHEHRA